MYLILQLPVNAFSNPVQKVPIVPFPSQPVYNQCLDGVLNTESLHVKSPSLYQPFPPANGNKGIQCDCRAPSATSCLCASMVSRSQLTLTSEDFKKSALLDDRYRASPPVISAASLAYGFSQSSNTSVDTIPGIVVNALIFG
jgi:hypothetical protein